MRCDAMFRGAMHRMMTLRTLFCIVLLQQRLSSTLASSRHFDEEEGAHFLNPDIAMGKTFHVAAKQLDGAQRCYFIRVGSRIEQGSVMHAKGTNGECKASYKKELALGNYDGTIDGDTQLRQEYRKGDSEFGGSRKDADLSKPCRL